MLCCAVLLCSDLDLVVSVQQCVFWYFEKPEKFPKACGIIYCCSKKDAEKLANTLTIKHSINSAFYHGSMEDKDKNSVQHMWTTNDIQVICATVGKTKKH